MALIGLELSDAGIMAATGDPPELLAVDALALESPGVAVCDRRQTVTGQSARAMARRYPHRTTNRFWERLDAAPWRPGRGKVPTHAEIAFAHLVHISRSFPKNARLMAAIPPAYDKAQLGRLLGMAQALAVDVPGFVPLSLAAAGQNCPDGPWLHLDIGLHRLNVSLLEQGTSLRESEVRSLPGKGLDYLHTQWMRAVADQFVQTTRFDPLHRGSGEQALYDRLPAIAAALRRQPVVTLSLPAGAKPHRISLHRETLVAAAHPVIAALAETIAELRSADEHPDQVMTVQATHRLMEVPGVAQMLSALDATEVLTLSPGAAALGALAWGRLIAADPPAAGPALFNRRPQTFECSAPAADPGPGRDRATHLLYRHRAVAVGQRPLVIGRDPEADIPIPSDVQGISRRHCTLVRRKGEVLLEDLSRGGTLLEDQPISGSVPLTVGQRFRVGSPPQYLKLIVVVPDHEA